MSDINKAVVVGRLTRDAEQSYTQSGASLLKFSMAVNRWRKDQNAEEANFFDVTVWGKQGESIAQYMVKGKQVAVEGELRQDRWADKNDGSNRSKVYIVANNVQMLGDSHGENRGSDGQAFSQQQTPPSKPAGGPPPASFEDDIPL